MIWEEFYLEPRYVLVVGKGGSRFGDTVEWVMQPRACKKNYYTAIDTEIDSLASIVAGRIRPELSIEVSKALSKPSASKLTGQSTSFICDGLTSLLRGFHVKYRTLDGWPVYKILC